MSEDMYSDRSSLFTSTTPSYSVNLTSPSKIHQFNMSFRNKSAFSDKYHNIFCEIIKSKSPDNAYWTKYIEKRDKLEKKYSGDLDLKTVQFKLEQQKLNYKRKQNTLSIGNLLIHILQ